MKYLIIFSLFLACTAAQDVKQPSISECIAQRLKDTTSNLTKSIDTCLNNNPTIAELTKKYEEQAQKIQNDIAACNNNVICLLRQLAKLPPWLLSYQQYLLQTYAQLILNEDTRKCISSAYVEAFKGVANLRKCI